ESCSHTAEKPPAGGGAPAPRTSPPQPPLQHPRDQPLQLHRRQRRRPFFSRDVSPPSGTTSPSTPMPGGDTTRARSAPHSPPGPPPLWPAASTPRSDAGP